MVLASEKEEVVNWIKNAEEIKPGNTMAGKYSVTDEEAAAIAEYLMSLSVEK